MVIYEWSARGHTPEIITFSFFKEKLNKLVHDVSLGDKMITDICFQCVIRVEYSKRFFRVYMPFIKLLFVHPSVMIGFCLFWRKQFNEKEIIETLNECLF